MFNDWKLDDGRVVRLLTEPELRNLKHGTKVWSIGGTNHTYSNLWEDYDTRGGYTAYGFLVEHSDE